MNKKSTVNRKDRPSSTVARSPVLRFRIRVTVGDAIAVGPGKIALLEAIGQTGSISGAAKSLGMSYRRAWLLIDELNRSLRAPAVVTAIGGTSGGGTAISETGHELIRLYRRIEEDAVSGCRKEIERMLDLITR